MEFPFRSLILTLPVFPSAPRCLSLPVAFLGEFQPLGLSYRRFILIASNMLSVYSYSFPVLHLYRAYLFDYPLGGGLGGTRRGGPDVNIKHSGREDDRRRGSGREDDRLP